MKIPRLFRWLIYATCLPAALLSGCATVGPAAEVPLHVIEADTAIVHLMGTPCVDENSLKIINAHAPADTRGKWKHVASTWRNKEGVWEDFAGCWYDLAADTVYLIFSDGANGPISKSEFKKTKGTGI